MGVSGRSYAPATLPSGNTQYPLCWRLGGLQGRSGRVRKISPTPGFDPRAVLALANSFSDYAERFNMYIPLLGLRYFVRWLS